MSTPVHVQTGLSQMVFPTNVGLLIRMSVLTHELSILMLRSLSPVSGSREKSSDLCSEREAPFFTLSC